MTDPATPAVQHGPDRQRHEIEADGRTGVTTYRDHGDLGDHDDQPIFYPPTEVAGKLTGRADAPRLVHDALTDARAAGKRVVAVRPCAVRREVHVPARRVRRPGRPGDAGDSAMARH